MEGVKCDLSIAAGSKWLMPSRALLPLIFPCLSLTVLHITLLQGIRLICLLGFAVYLHFILSIILKNLCLNPASGGAGCGRFNWSNDLASLSGKEWVRREGKISRRDYCRSCEGNIIWPEQTVGDALGCALSFLWRKPWDSQSSVWVMSVSYNIITYWWISWKVTWKKLSENREHTIDNKKHIVMLDN